MGLFKRKSGVDILTGFKLHSSQLLDARQNVDTIEERDALVEEFHLTTGGLRVFVEENKTSYIFNGEDWDEIGGLPPQLATVAISGSYNDLKDKPPIPSLPTLSRVAVTGSYNDLLDIPSIPTVPTLADVATSGDYNDLKNKPELPTIPTLATVATSGDYNDLINKPDINSMPTLADVATSGLYNDLIDKPIFASVATSGKYGDLTGIPTFASVATSGDYNDLRNKPNIPVVPTLAAVATSGSYNDLSNKPAAYVHPTTAGNKHIPAGGGAGQVLKWSASGTAAWGYDTATSCPVGTVLFSKSASATFFNACFGGSWSIIGYVDALVASSTIKLYAFEKIA